MLGETVSLLPSEEDQIRDLNRTLQLGTPALIGLGNERIELPKSLYILLKDVVRQMMAGRTITLVPEKQQLTTQSAANFLGFSRPHLIKLLESGVIPFERVGQHRRIRLEDVRTFQKKRDAERRSALNDLAKAEYEEGLYEGIAISEGGSDE